MSYQSMRRLVPRFPSPTNIRPRILGPGLRDEDNPYNFRLGTNRDRLDEAMHKRGSTPNVGKKDKMYSCGEVRAEKGNLCEPSSAKRGRSFQLFYPCTIGFNIICAMLTLCKTPRKPASLLVEREPDRIIGAGGYLPRWDFSPSEDREYCIGYEPSYGRLGVATSKHLLGNEYHAHGIRHRNLTHTGLIVYLGTLCKFQPVDSGASKRRIRVQPSTQG